MSSSTLITKLLQAPLGDGWTIDEIAEQVLAIVANEPSEVVIDAASLPDNQSRRLFRPLLACLVTKSNRESGREVSLYGGGICFRRTGDDGDVWIVGEISNSQGNASLRFRSSQPPGSATQRNRVPVDSIPQAT